MNAHELHQRRGGRSNRRIRPGCTVESRVSTAGITEGDTAEVRYVSLNAPVQTLELERATGDTLTLTRADVKHHPACDNH